MQNVYEKNILFIKNIPVKMNYTDIKNIFHKYDKLGFCSLIVDQKTGISKGVCVIEILDDNNYKKLLEMKNIIINDDIILELYKYKQKYKKKYNNNIDPNDMYRIEVNSGKNNGMTEMITQHMKNKFS